MDNASYGSSVLSSQITLPQQRPPAPVGPADIGGAPGGPPFRPHNHPLPPRRPPRRRGRRGQRMLQRLSDQRDFHGAGAQSEEPLPRLRRRVEVADVDAHGNVLDQDQMPETPQRAPARPRGPTLATPPDNLEEYDDMRRRRRKERRQKRRERRERRRQENFNKIRHDAVRTPRGQFANVHNAAYFRKSRADPLSPEIKREIMLDIQRRHRRPAEFIPDETSYLGKRGTSDDDEEARERIKRRKRHHRLHHTYQNYSLPPIPFSVGAEARKALYHTGGTAHVRMYFGSPTDPPWYSIEPPFDKTPKYEAGYEALGYTAEQYSNALGDLPGLSGEDSDMDLL